MTPRLIKITIALLFCGVIILSGCAAQSTELSFEAMDTFMRVKLFSDNGESASLKIRAETERLDALLSTADKSSAVRALNEDGSLQNGEVADLTRRTLELCGSTGGALDISVYPLVEEWGFISRDYKIPSRERIASLLEGVDYRSVKAEGELVTLRPGMKIDFGAVAKGYLADRLSAVLDEEKTASALLNLGGTVYARGKKPDGSRWTVGIADPENSADFMGSLECEDRVVATSGSYERFFTGSDGRLYCHIIDPKTGYPVDNGVKSVTVVCESGLKSDALSTALFVMGKEKAAEYYKKNGGFEYILLTDKTAYVSDGLIGDFNLARTASYEIEAIR